MTPAPFEQRNAYRGTPERAWVSVRFLAPDGSTREVPLLADTGCPYAFILSRPLLQQLLWYVVADRTTNFGVLTGGGLHVRMPELGIDGQLIGYGSDHVAQVAQQSSPDFEGLAGLPFLRTVEYGGDPTTFWVRPLPAAP